MSTNKEFNNVQLDVKFTRASTRENLVSEENISVSFGKISKYFADLHSQAFTGYTHPSHTAYSSGLYKVTVDGLGHVTAASTVTGSDLPAHEHPYLPLAGGTLTGRVTTSKFLNYIVKGTGTAGADKGSGQNPRYVPAKWTFNTGQTASDGDIIIIKIPVAGHDYGVYISIDNGTTYHPAVITGSSRLTTHYGNGNYAAFTFRSDGSAASMIPLAGNTDGTRVTVTGGVWQGIDYYDSGNNYDRTSVQTRIYAGGVGVFRYSICGLNSAQRMESFTTTGDANGSPTTTKTFNTSAKFSYPPVIMYNSANAVYANGNAIGNNVLYEQYPSIDMRYSCNKTSSASTGFTQYKPVFIECTFDDNGFWSITSNGFVQTFTSGKYYILVGCMYSTSVYQLAIFSQHPVYYYDGTNLTMVPFTKAEKTKLTGISEGATKTEASTNGKIKIDGTDTTVYTHPTYTSKTSGLYKITVDSTGHVSGTAAVQGSDIPHPPISTSTDTTSTPPALSDGGTFEAIDSVTRDLNGHVTKINTVTYTLPTHSFTDTKVDQTLSSADEKHPLLIANPQTTNTTATVNGSAFRSNSIYATLSTGAITASKIYGSGTEGQSTAPTGGYHIYDCRNIAITPAHGDKSANFYFHMTGTPDTGKWWSILHMRGWVGEYAAWEIAGPSHNTDQRTTPLYVRTSNKNTTWGSWRKIYDSSNKPTASDLGFGTIVTHNEGDYVLKTGDTMSGDLTLAVSDNSNSPALIFRRGTLTDNYNDWKIYNSGGHLYFAISTANASTETWTNKVYINGSTNKLYVGSTAVSLEGHTHNYAGSSSAGGAATNFDTTVTNGSTSTVQYGIVFVADPNVSEANVARKNNDFRLNLRNGTTSAAGQSELVLGNNKTSTTADNKQGIISMYSKSTSYHMITVADTTTVVQHVLPATGGTVLNTGTTSFTQTLSSGTKIGTIKINGTSTDIYCETNTNTDTKVNVTLATTTKAYLLGTSTTPTSTAQAVTSLADTGVYLGTTAGSLCATTVQASSTVCANTSNSSTAGGISLYSTDPETYGIMFRGTSNSGKHGYVQSDWATYFTMNQGATTRGWIFRKKTDGPVASISGAGNAVFNGSVTVGGNSANTSGCRMTYNSTTQTMDFVFA